MIRILGSLFLFLVFTFQVICADSGNTAVYEAAVKDPFDEQAVAAFLKTLPKDGGYYVVEGDLLVTEQEVKAYLVSKSSGATVVVPKGELLVAIYQGQPSYWKTPESRKLNYSVDKTSFPNQAGYDKVVESMKQATEAWEKACPACGVDFLHLTNLDSNPNPTNVTFIVKHHDSQGDYIAAAFFPYYAVERRVITIDPSFFSTSFDKVGVLRHELGHVLGYRHEHTRGVSGCYWEDDQWKPLTEYDPHSVMHYFCGGGGSLKLELSDLDKQGHAALYAVKN